MTGAERTGAELTGAETDDALPDRAGILTMKETHMTDDQWFDERLSRVARVFAHMLADDEMPPDACDWIAQGERVLRNIRRADAHNLNEARELLAVAAAYAHDEAGLEAVDDLSDLTVRIERMAAR
jgi:hypothetical protein